MTLLQDKTAVLYGAAGAVGGAVAKGFAQQGARLFVTGRTLEPVERLAADIAAMGGRATAAEVDALDRQAVECHLAQVVAAVGIWHGRMMLELSVTRAEHGCDPDRG